MERFSLWMTIVGTVLTLIQTIVSIIKDRQSKKRMKEGRSSYQHNNNRMFYFIITTSWFVIMLILWTLTIVFKWKNYIVIWCGFGFSILFMIVYAASALRSFETTYIYPPKALWQVLFNKIPSWLKNGNQKVFNFLVLKMDDSTAVEMAARNIETNYEQNTNFKVEVQSCFDGIVPIDIREDFCGMLCLIGEKGCKNMETIEASPEKCSNQPDNLDLPIAYSYIGCDSLKLKYEQVNESFLKDFAPSLIMRSYRRSKEWIGLCEKTYKALIMSIILGAILFAGCVVLGSRMASYIMSPPEELSPKINNIDLRNVDVEAIRKDAGLKDYFDQISNYMFGDIMSPTVKIWLRNNDQTALKNIYFSAGLDENTDKGKGSLIGDVADNRVFVLWPGHESNEDVYIWAINGNRCAVKEKRSGEHVDFLIPAETESRRIKWEKTDNPKDNELSIYGFSYDGLLAIELDYSSISRYRNNVWKYLKTKAFRNEMRKFYVAVASALKMYVPKENNEAKTVPLVE